VVKHYAASRKVAGSSPDEVDFFKIDVKYISGSCFWVEVEDVYLMRNILGFV
jgi:hypothetical protein